MPSPIPLSLSICMLEFPGIDLVIFVQVLADKLKL